MKTELMRRGEGLFALADQLEKRLAKARGQVDQLTPPLLARAFARPTRPPRPHRQTGIRVAGTNSIRA
jgi:hypothetical protein